MLHQCNALSQNRLHSQLSAYKILSEKFASLHKTAPDAALLGVCAVKYTLFLHHVFGFCCSVSVPGLMKQISTMGSFFAWVHLLSSQWTPLQAWMLVKLRAQVELISLLAGCHWGMWSLQHHTVDSTAFSGLPVFRSLYHYLLLSCFLECVISASTWLMILCMFKCVLTLFHHLDSSVNFTLHRFFSHWQN